MHRRIFFFIAALYLFVNLFSQETGDVNFNQKYKYPFGLSVLYQTYFPLNRDSFSSGGEYSHNDISLTARLPIPRIPMIQPMVQAGVVLVEASEAVDEKRNHTQIYGNIGSFYTHKLSKMIERGAELGALPMSLQDRKEFLSWILEILRQSSSAVPTKQIMREIFF